MNICGFDEFSDDIQDTTITRVLKISRTTSDNNKLLTITQKFLEFNLKLKQLKWLRGVRSLNVKAKQTIKV